MSSYWSPERQLAKFISSEKTILRRESLIRVSDIAVKPGRVGHGVTAVVSPGSSLYGRVAFEAGTDVTMTYDTGRELGTKRPRLWNL
jgi:hypothetical protein